MARQLPVGTDHAVAQTDDPSILYVDDERTAAVVSALASESGLAIFRSLTETAMTPSEVAAEREVTVQNAMYHLSNLEDAGLIEVIDTCYSEKGREMDLYAATSDPKVLVLASESDESHLRKAFAQMAGALGVTGLVVAAWQALAGVADRLLDS